MLYKKCNTSRRRELRRTVPELTYSFAAVGHQLPVLSGAFDFVVLARHDKRSLSRVGKKHEELLCHYVKRLQGVWCAPRGPGQSMRPDQGQMIQDFAVILNLDCNPGHTNPSP